ncbi:MAG: Ig-like domain-containing protein [Candidatus Saccharibacteria bacterium]
MIFLFPTGVTCGGVNAKIFTDVSGASVGSALIIRNNTISNGDLDGVHIGGGSGLLVENNTFYNLTDSAAHCKNGAQVTDGSCDGDPAPSGCGDSNHTDNIQFQGASLTTIRGNYIKSGPTGATQGITSFDSGTNGVIIENNVVDIRRPWGIELYADQNSIVRHNTVVWHADADCDFNNYQCGLIDINYKTANGPGSGTRVYDNITTGVNFSPSTAGTASHNVSGQTAVYQGGANLTSHDSYLLAANSPVGRSTASDGMNNGIFTNDGTITLPSPSETTPPTVSMTTPTNNATVSGTSVTLTATAADEPGGSGLASIQFKLDGNTIGTAGTTSPYSITWNSTTVSNGSHKITAIAYDAAGNSTTSSEVAITVTNTGSITIGETAVAPNGDSGNGNLLIAQQASLGQTATIQSLSFYVHRCRWYTSPWYLRCHWPDWWSWG